MNATTTCNAIGQRQAAVAGQRLIALRSVLGALQVSGVIATLVCLFLTGPSVWTLLVGLLAAGFAKASLAMMDHEPEFAQDDGAIDEVLLRIYGKNPRGRHDLHPSC